MDLNEDPALLREHSERNGFDWRYALSNEALNRAIFDEYGAQFLNPPNVPMLLIRPDNSIVALPFGIKAPDELAAFVESNRLQE